MLRIRQDQMDAFREPLLEDFVDRLARHLRAMFEDDLASLDDGQLKAMLHRVIRKAGDYGVQIEFDVARYAEYSVFLGERFDENAVMPWAGAILRDVSLSGTERMNRLDTIATEVFTTDEDEP
jgi:hypothetical protein